MRERHGAEAAALRDEAVRRRWGDRLSAVLAVRPCFGVRGCYGTASMVSTDNASDFIRERLAPAFEPGLRAPPTSLPGLHGLLKPCEAIVGVRAQATRRGSGSRLYRKGFLSKKS